MNAKKIIIIGLFIATFEVVVVVIYLNQSGKKTMNLPIKQQTQIQSTNPSAALVSASLVLSSDKTNIKVSETVLVSVKLKVLGKASTASDLTIKYDPAYLSPTSLEKPFNKGEIYEKIVFNEVDFKSGVATMSAISSLGAQNTQVGGPFLGEGVLATIPFKALRIGQTEVKVVFSPGNTTDSNVVVDAKDVLGSVSNLSLQIAP